MYLIVYKHTNVGCHLDLKPDTVFSFKTIQLQQPIKPKPTNAYVGPFKIMFHYEIL